MLYFKYRKMHIVHKSKGEETMDNNSKLEFDFANVTAELEKKI